MRILGVDPGLAIVGWGVLDYENGKFAPVDFGSVQTPSHTDTPARIKMVFDGIDEIMEKYAPDCLSIEELFWNTNQKTGIAVAEVRGTILLCAKQHGLSIAEYTPLQVKQAVVGYGRADKKQVITMVSALLKLKRPPKPDDTADALALAICHANQTGSRLGKYYNKLS